MATPSISAPVTELGRTSGESLIGCCASARQLGKSRGLFGMRAERAAVQAAGVDAAVGDQPILGLGIFLVEKMIAEREKDWPALDALQEPGQHGDDARR